MKKKIFFLFSSIFVLCTLVACQQTPEGQNYYKEASKEISSLSNTNNIPQKIELQKEDQAKHILVDISANIDFPQGVDLFKAKIEPAHFSFDQVQPILNTVFDPNEYKIDDRLDSYRYGVNLYETGQFDNLRCPSPEAYAEYLEIIKGGGEGDQEARLKILKDRDPAEYERQVSLLQDPHNPSKLLLNEKWVPKANEEEIKPYVACNNSNLGQAELSYNTKRSTGMAEENSQNNMLKLTQEDAVQQATEWLSKFGIKNYKFSDQIIAYDFAGMPVDDSHAVYYRIYFVPEIEGLDLNFHYLDSIGQSQPANSAEMNEEEKLDAVYAPTWNHTTLYIDLDDIGVRAFYWGSPFTILDKIALDYNQDLANFENAVDKAVPRIISKYILVPHIDGDAQEGATDKNGINNRITIDEIKFGLARIPVKDRVGEYELVPAWDFIGTQEIYNAESDCFELHYDMYSGERQCFATVNALDSSLIDRAYGN